jgi:choline dehydrogenase-like flavoprotein
MRLLVVGAGSTGGYFGGRLAQAGRDVTFLVRPRRAAQLQEGGLQIVSPHGDVTVRPKLVTANDIDAPYDAVLLAVKAYSLDGAIDDFATAAPLLNYYPLDLIEAQLAGGSNQRRQVRPTGENANVMTYRRWLASHDRSAAPRWAPPEALTQI